MQKVDLEYQHIANITPIKNIVICKNKESTEYFLENVYQIFCEVDTNWIDVNSVKEMLQEKGFNSFDKIGKSPSHYDLLISRQ